MNVYKVVERLDDGTLASAVAFGKAKVVYIPNEWVAAPKWLRESGYHLTAFREYEYAYTFAKKVISFKPWEIWLAEAEGVLEKLPPSRYMLLLAQGKLGEYAWDSWPKGTVMCRALKLVKKLKEIKPKL